MSLSEAHRLCPHAIFIKGNLKYYREISYKFMDILMDFSPCIEPLGLDEAFLDVSGYEQPFGSYRLMAIAVKERVKEELALIVSIGIARCKVVAKVASALSKPDGLLEVATGEERRFLAPLSIAKLPGVGKKTEKVLKELSVGTIGDLASLSPGIVGKHFGASGLLLHSYANGVDDREVKAPNEPESISQETTFNRDTRDQHFLNTSLRRLCEEVSMKLRTKNRRARCVTLKLRFADFKLVTRQVTLKEGSDVSRLISTMALQLLGRVLLAEREPIRMIGVKVSSLINKEQQYCMFDSKDERWESLDKAVDRIRMKYGERAIRSGDNISKES